MFKVVLIYVFPMTLTDRQAMVMAPPIMDVTDSLPFKINRQ